MPDKQISGVFDRVKKLSQTFYKQIILQRGLPFDVKIPLTKPVSVATLTEEQLDAELEKGYADILEGRTKAANMVFADIRKDYGL